MAIFTAIGTAIAAVGAWVGSLGIIGGALLKAAVGIGLNLLAQSLAGKPKDPTFSINTTIQGGGDVPRSILLGKTATAGSLVWVNTWGQDGDSKNAYLTQVIALSDRPINGLTGTWVNSEKVDLVGNNTGWGKAVQQYRKDGRDNLWVKFYDGTQTTADTFLTNTCSNNKRQWSSRRVGRGASYVIITALVSKNMFSGIPSFKFEVDGAKLYDITKDSSAGGNGSQRWSDYSTWGGDGDHLPAVQIYNVLRGIEHDNKWLYGLQGVTASRLPAVSWIKQVNKCRQQVQGAHGLEPMYRSGGELPVDAPIATALEAMLTACQGRISEVGGTYEIHIGAPDAPVIHFTDADILSTDEQTFTPFFGLADTINGISATYPSPADGWVTKTAPPLYHPDLEARHGNRRLLSDVPLDFVPYAEQVQRLMKSALLEAQRARRHTLVLPPRFWAYCTPGEYIVWSSVRNGYEAKMFRIDGVADKANFDVLVDITEVDPADYDWNSSTDFRPPIDGDVGPIRPEPMPIISFGANKAIAQDSNGNNRRVGIQLFWDGTVNAVDFVQYEVRKTETLAIVDTGRTEEVARASIIIAPGTLLPNQSYDVHARYGTYDGNTEFIWSDWIRVITDDIRLGPLDIYPISIEGLNKDIKDYNEWASGRDRYFQEELDRIGNLVSVQDLSNFFDKQQLRQEAVQTYGTARAAWRLEINVATGPNSALAQRIETVEVSLGEDLSQAVTSLQSQISDVDGRVDANSAAITRLKSQVDDDIAVAVTSLETQIVNVDGRVTVNSNAITALQSQVADDIATAIQQMGTQITNVDGRVTANAQAVQQLTAEVDGVASSITVRSEVQQSPGGGWVRHGIYLQSGGVANPAAFYMDIRDGVSRIVNNSDQWMVTNGVNSQAPMTFINGALALQVANIGEVTAGVIRSPDGKFVINLAEGYLRISD